MGYIYVITNQINNKQYVGQTSFSIQDRFKQHIKDSKKQDIQNRPLYKAFNKYGTENFSISLLEECPQAQINEREQYWIEKLNTFHNGYNATLGGEGIILYDHDLILQRLLNGEYAVDIWKDLNCDPLIVRKIAKDNNIALKNKHNDTSSIKIVCYDKEHNFIQEFLSIMEASKWLIENNYAHTPMTEVKNIRGKLSLAAKGKRKTAYGFIWKFVD